MKNEKFDQVIDEVYKHYQETHQYEPFILRDEMDLSKEDFIKKVTNNYGFGQLFGISLNERELSESERYDHLKTYKSMLCYDGRGNVMEYYDSINIPTKVITLFYKGEEIEVYE